MEVLLIYLAFGGVAAAIASSKGRSPLGWFFIGVLFSCIAIIILLCLPNLKEIKAKEERLEEENRRIREQVRQEQMRLEAFRQQTNLRLQRHDQALQMDTSPRADSPLGLGADPGLPPSLPNAGQDEHHPVWFYAKGADRCGPVSLSALRALVAGGEVSGDSLFWRNGLVEWQPGRNIAELRIILG
jgi:hypothetical protein